VRKCIVFRAKIAAFFAKASSQSKIATTSTSICGLEAGAGSSPPSFFLQHSRAPPSIFDQACSFFIPPSGPEGFVMTKTQGRMALMQIDPGMLDFYKELSAKTPPGSDQWPLDQQRAAWNELCAQFRAPRPPGLQVSDLETDDVKFRLFVPEGADPKPGVLYFHGGGWVLGGPETHDDMCAEMAAGAGCAVALVDYRLAPEHPHPAQLEDSLKVWNWMRAHGVAHGTDPENILAAGDSAGGQMSVALALTLKEMKLPQLQGLVLIYPVLGADLDTPSYIRNAHAPCLNRDEMAFYLASFLGSKNSANWRDEKALPNLAPDVSGLPPTFITVADHDPLHDDGVLFFHKLQAAGIECMIREEPALAHSYMRARHVSAPAKKGFDAIVEALRSLSHRQTQRTVTSAPIFTNL
jgi:acetyl esterase